MQRHIITLTPAGLAPMANTLIDAPRRHVNVEGFMTHRRHILYKYSTYENIGQNCALSLNIYRASCLLPPPRCATRCLSAYRASTLRGMSTSTLAAFARHPPAGTLTISKLYCLSIPAAGSCPAFSRRFVRGARTQHAARGRVYLHGTGRTCPALYPHPRPRPGIWYARLATGRQRRAMCVICLTRQFKRRLALTTDWFAARRYVLRLPRLHHRAAC